MLSFRALVVTCVATLTIVTFGSGSARADSVIDTGSDDEAKFFIGVDNCLCGEDALGFLHVTVNPADEIGSQIAINTFNPMPDYQSFLFNLYESDGTTLSDSFEILAVSPKEYFSVVLASDPNAVPNNNPQQKIVVETGDWQNIGRFFGVDDSFVQIRSDVESTVPLPATLPLFASGLAGLGWLGRRRKRQPTQA